MLLSTRPGRPFGSRLTLRKGVLQSELQQLQITRLPQKFGGPQFERFPRHLFIGHTGKNQYDCGWRDGPDSAKYLQTVQIRHPDVQQNRVERAGLQSLERRAPSRCDRRVIPGGLKRQGQPLGNRLVVIYDQVVSDNGLGCVEGMLSLTGRARIFPVRFIPTLERVG